jgi:hypothetical protein
VTQRGATLGGTRGTAVPLRRTNPAPAMPLAPEKPRRLVGISAKNDFLTLCLLAIGLAASLESSRWADALGLATFGGPHVAAGK